MEDHIRIDRLQFTLTVSFHYLFPLLTMGLALFMAYMKSVAYLGRPDRRLRVALGSPQPLLEDIRTARPAHTSLE